MDYGSIYQLKYHITKKEFKEGIFDLVFKEAKNKEEVKETKYIQIPKVVKSIGEHAFKDCKSLTSITIPKIFESRINEIFKHLDLSSIKIIYT